MTPDAPSLAAKPPRRAAAEADALLLPAGACLLHVGPHKTATTTVQTVFHRARSELLELGVRYAGRARQQVRAAHAVNERPWRLRDGEVPPMRAWQELAREVRAERRRRVIVSSEFFSEADTASIQRIAADLGQERLHVVMTLRPLARIIPSQWQQWVQNGMTKSWPDWLTATLDSFERPAGERVPLFWWRHRHDLLVERWVGALGPDRLTIIVIDERDRGMVLRVFERLLGLPEGLLVSDGDRTNRSLTLPEAEAVRAFNIAYKAEGLPKDQHSRLMRLGAAQLMKLRQPPPDEPRVEMPQWALDRVAGIQRRYVEAITASGARIIGDVESLAVVPTSRLAGDAPSEVAIPAEVAAAMAMGIVAAGGLARGRVVGGWIEPPELRRTSTYYLVGTLGIRTVGWLAARWRRLLRRLAIRPAAAPGRRG